MKHVSITIKIESSGSFLNVSNILSYARTTKIEILWGVANSISERKYQSVLEEFYLQFISNLFIIFLVRVRRISKTFDSS